MVTIFIEDYVRSPNAISRVFNASGLMKYWYPMDQMPRNGSWPLLSKMIEHNHRLLVFTSVASKEASEGIAFEWNYVVENKCKNTYTCSAEPMASSCIFNSLDTTPYDADGDEGMNSTSCANRAESPPMNTTSKSLVLMNYFQTTPISYVACTNNLSPLVNMLRACHNFSAKRWANFVAVDFYLVCITSQDRILS